MKETRDNGGGLSLQTLVIASLASGTAALVVSQFWKGGTIMSAAVTPVIVAIVSELLHRPARQVTRFTSAPRERGREMTIPPGPAEPSTAGLERLGSQVRRRPPRRGLHWRVALVTGLLAFSIAALVLTVPELISGSSAFGNRDTTLFGGGDTQDQPQDSGDGQQDEEQQPTETTPPAQPEQSPEGGQAPSEQTQPPEEQAPSDSAPPAQPPPETQAPQSQPAP